MGQSQLQWVNSGRIPLTAYPETHLHLLYPISDRGTGQKARQQASSKLHHRNMNATQQGTTQLRTTTPRAMPQENQRNLPHTWVSRHQATMTACVHKAQYKWNLNSDMLGYATCLPITGHRCQEGAQLEYVTWCRWVGATGPREAESGTCWAPGSPQAATVPWHREVGSTYPSHGTTLQY